LSPGPERGAVEVFPVLGDGAPSDNAGAVLQDSVTAGRVENGQVGVFVAYASRRRQALIDRRLYRTKSGPTTRRGASTTMA